MNLLKDKKVRYFIVSALLVINLVAMVMVGGNYKIMLALLSVFVALAGSFIVLEVKNLLSVVVSLLLPLHIIAGTLLSLYYFPNLSLVMKILAVISVGCVLYATFLVNNIFLVVESMDKLIPLYRVAVTWAQILVIVICIPYFTGIFKMPTNSLMQNAITAFSAFLFSFYLLWGQSLDTDTKVIKVGERIVSSLIVAFVTFSMGVTVSFFPTENFLRAIFISSVLMSILGYIYSHYVNRITKLLMVEYTFINGIFFVLLLIFS